MRLCRDQPIIRPFRHTELRRRESGHAGKRSRQVSGRPRWAGLLPRGADRAWPQKPTTRRPAQALSPRRRRRRSPRAWRSPLLAGSASRGPAPRRFLRICEGGLCVPIGGAGPLRLRPLPGPTRARCWPGLVGEAARVGSCSQTGANGALGPP